MNVLRLNTVEDRVLLKEKNHEHCEEGAVIIMTPFSH